MDGDFWWWLIKDLGPLRFNEPLPVLRLYEAEDPLRRGELFLKNQYAWEPWNLSSVLLWLMDQHLHNLFWNTILFAVPREAMEGTAEVFGT